jgi:hypothetical protein
MNTVTSMASTGLRTLCLAYTGALQAAACGPPRQAGLQC